MQSTLKGFMGYLMNSVKTWKSIWNRKGIASANSIQANEVVSEGGNPAQILNMGVVEMGTKTFRVTAQVIDETSGKTDSTTTVEQNGQSSLGVCDLQDLLMSTYGAGLSAKGRAFAQAKADAEAGNGSAAAQQNAALQTLQAAAIQNAAQQNAVSGGGYSATS